MTTGDQTEPSRRGKLDRRRKSSSWSLCDCSQNDAVPNSPAADQRNLTLLSKLWIEPQPQIDVVLSGVFIDHIVTFFEDSFRHQTRRLQEQKCSERGHAGHARHYPLNYAPIQADRVDLFTQRTWRRPTGREILAETGIVQLP